MTQINREQVMEYFREDEFIEDLSIDDKTEIAMHCLCWSDDLSKILEHALNLEEGE